MPIVIEGKVVDPPEVKKDETSPPNPENENEPKKPPQSITERFKTKYQEMHEKGREFMDKIYDKMPLGAKRFLAKAEVAFTDQWVDKYDEKAQEHTAKATEYSNEAQKYSNTIDTLREQIQSVSDLGLAVDTKELEKQVTKLEEKKKKAEEKSNKFREKQEKAQQQADFFNKRVKEVGEMMTTAYGEKLKPMEGNLQNLENQKKDVEFVANVAEINLKRTEAKIGELKNTKNTIENTLRGAGVSEREIRKKTKEISKKIEQAEVEIQAARAEFEEKQRKIQEKIEKAKEKAKPYQNKKAEFEDMVKGADDYTNETAQRREDLQKEQEEKEQGEKEKRERERKEKEKQAKLQEEARKAEREKTYTLEDLIKQFSEKYPYNAVLLEEMSVKLEEMGIAPNATFTPTEFMRIAQAYAKFIKEN